MSDRTLIEGGSPESPGGPKTVIEGGGSGAPADGRTVLEQSGTPVGQSPIGINSIHLAPGVQIAGCVLREQLRVISGEADLWLAEQPGRQELAVLKVFRWGVQPKAEVAEKLRNIPKAQVVEVLGSGVLSDGRHFELLEYIQSGTLANLVQPGGVPSALARQSLLELTEALTEIHAAGILHRDLKPSNILIRRREPLNLVLTDFGISSLSDQTSLYVTGVQRTAAYSAPEAMTGIIGRSSDWWSVGVMLLELLTGRHPFAGMDERVVNFQLVSRGIEVPASLPDEWQLLLKGLLTRDHQKRWGGEQVRAWLTGQRDIPFFYQTGPQHAAQYKPYKFLGKDCATPAELAREAGQAKNWDEGVKCLQRRYIQDWVKQDVRDFDLLGKLQDVEDDKNLDWEQKLCVALLVLDPELPLCWRGEIVTHDWISAQAIQDTQNLNQALALLTSSLPEWLQRCRNQTWMLDTRQRRQRLQTDIGQLGLNLGRGDVDKVIFLPFQAVNANAQRRKEVVHSAVTEADEPLKALLAKPEWNEAECVAVVTCPFSRFLTKEQRWLEVKRAAESNAESLFRRAKAENKISELQTVDSLLVNLDDSLEQDFTSLSQPVPFDRGDEQLRERIEEGSQVCRRRIRLKKRTRRIVFVSSLSLVALCAIGGLHLLLLENTFLSFTFSLDAKDVPPNKKLNVTVDGKPFGTGDKIKLGRHQIAVTFSGGEPYTREVRIFYGKNDLGLLPLESSKGALSVTVQPSPATVTVEQDGQVFQQGDAPLKIATLPVGEYSLLIRRGKYEENHLVDVGRQQLSETNIVLNLGSAELSSEPPDAQFELSGNGHRWEGQMPIHIDEVPVGVYQFIARRKGWELNQSITIKRAAIAAGKLEFQYASLKIASEPTGMIVSVDGVEIGKAPKTLDELKPGLYRLTATDGENDLTAEITVGPKENGKHTFVFHYGAVQIASTPLGATVLRKGNEIGKTPLTISRIAAGETTFVLNLVGYVSTNFTLHVTENATANFNVKLTSKRYLEAMQQAREALHAGQFANAQKSLAIAEGIEPGDNQVKALGNDILFKIHYQKAEVLLSGNNQFNEALVELAEAEKLHPDSEDVVKLRQMIERQRLERFNGLVQNAESSFSRDRIDEANRDLNEAEKLVANNVKVTELRARIAPALRNIFWNNVAGKIPDSTLSQSHVWTFRTDWAGARLRMDKILKGFLGAWKVQSESRPNNQTIILILEPRGIYKTSEYSCALMLSEVQSGVIEIRSKMCVANPTRGWEGQQLSSLDNMLFSDLQQQFGQPLSR